MAVMDREEIISEISSSFLQELSDENKVRLRDWVIRVPLRLSQVRVKNASYFLFKGQAAATYFNDQFCHAQLKPLRSGGIVNIVLTSIGVGAQSHSKAVRMYQDWITGPESPYKLLFDKVKIIRTSPVNLFLVFSGEFDENELRLIRNFAIALRMVGEKPHKILLWRDFVDAGLSGAEAILLGMYFNRNENGTLSGKAYEITHDHWPVSYHKVDWNRFISGTPKFDNWSGLNDIWSSEKLKEKLIPHSLIEAMCGTDYSTEMFNTKDSNSSLRKIRKEERSNWGVSEYYLLEEVLEWYKLEKEKYGIKSPSSRE